MHPDDPACNRNCAVKVKQSRSHVHDGSSRSAFWLQTGSHDRDQRQRQLQTSPAERATLCFRNGCVWPAALHRILRAGAVREGGSTLQDLSSCVMPGAANDIIASPASLASPDRPVPPSIMPSRTKNKPARSGIGMTAHSTRRRPTTVVPCGSQSGDMGRARTLHSSRDVLFGSSLLTGEVG